MKKRTVFTASVLLAGFMFMVPDVTTAQTLSTSPCSRVTSALRIGSRDISTGGQVTVLQKLLYSKGYLKDTPTGFFGGMTRKALQTFQKDNGLEETGSLGPRTRVLVQTSLCSSLSATPLATSSVQVTQVTSPKNEVSSMSHESSVLPQTAAFQIYVDNQIQVDASAVSKEYGDTLCKKLQGSSSGVVRCLWNGKEFSVLQATSNVTAPAAEVVVVQTSTTSVSGIGSSQPVSISPFVQLLISPTSVPYQGGYDSFELKSQGMASCTLYFKDEPSSSWTSGGSTLGTNYTLPGYKGMTKSRSYYSACVSASGTKMDSQVVRVQVAVQ